MRETGRERGKGERKKEGEERIDDKNGRETKIMSEFQWLFKFLTLVSLVSKIFLTVTLFIDL